MRWRLTSRILSDADPSLMNVTIEYTMRFRWLLCPQLVGQVMSNTIELAAVLHDSKLNAMDLPIGVARTLLVSLHHRATQSIKNEGQFKDEMGEYFHRKISFDWSKFNDESLHWMMINRTEILDEKVTDFIVKNHDSFVINLGAGLCTRFYRLKTGRVTWIEMDLPEVIAFRKKLNEPQLANHIFLPGSILNAKWIERVRQFVHGKTLFVAEGLMNYFSEEENLEIFEALTDNFPGQEMLLSILSRDGVNYANETPSLHAAHTRMKSRIVSGVQLALINPQIQFIDEWYVADRNQNLMPPEIRKMMTSPAAKNRQKIAHIRFL